MRRVVLNRASFNQFRWNQACAANFVLLIACQLLAATSVFAQPARVSGPVESSRVVLAGNRSYNPKLENDRGPLDASRVIEGMSLVFRRSAAQTADLAKLLEEQQDPSSPSYRAWLTPDQYADRFGLTPAELAKVTSWLEAQGFRVDYVSRSRTWVLFSGAAGQVQSAFHTELHRYEFNGTSHYANATDPSIPAATRAAGLAGARIGRLSHPASETESDARSRLHIGRQPCADAWRRRHYLRYQCALPEGLRGLRTEDRGGWPNGHLFVRY